MGLRVNIVRAGPNEFRIFGDTKDVKDTLIKCHGRYDKRLQNPMNKKYMPGWKVDVTYIQYTIMQLEKRLIKIYLNGK